MKAKQHAYTYPCYRQPHLAAQRSHVWSVTVAARPPGFPDTALSCEMYPPVIVENEQKFVSIKNTIPS